MKTRIISTILYGVLLISPIYMNFVNIDFFNTLFNIPTTQKHKESKIVPILDENKLVEETTDVTIWPNGTKFIDFRWFVPNLTKECRNFRFNATHVIEPETQMQSMFKPMVAYATINPQKPPIVPPPPVAYYDWDGLWFLPKGTHYPPGQDPMGIRYDQDDNHFSYHPKDWWSDWSYYGDSKIHWHLGMQTILDAINGVKSWTDLCLTVFALGGFALAGLATAAGYFAATAAAGSIAAAWCPPAAAVLAIGAGLSALLAFMMSQRGTNMQDYFINKVQTYYDDGFGWLTVCEALDRWLVYEWYYWRPGCERWHYSERTYSVSFGKERDQPIGTWTSWEMLYDIMPPVDLHCPNVSWR